jgi:hypothetical protein
VLGASPAAGKCYSRAEEIADVTLQRSAQPVDNFELRVLAAAFQPSQGRLTDPEPSGQLPLAESGLLT